MVAVTTIAIESLQINAIAGRDASLGDILMNIGGGSIGMVIGAHLYSILQPPRSLALKLAAIWLAAWGGVVGLAAYASVPSLPEKLYYGQLGGAFDESEALAGVVERASIGRFAISDGPLGQTPRLRTALLSRGGARVQVWASLESSLTNVAPMLRVVDGENEILGISREGSDLSFGIRTRAADLRLRPLRFGLPDALPAFGGSRRIHMNAVYTRQDVWLSANTSASISSTRLEPRAATAWRLVAPFPVVVSRTWLAMLLDGFWVALWALPTAYWAAIAGSQFEARGIRWLIPIGAAAGLAASLFLLPSVWGAPAATRADIVAVAAGCAAGAVLSRFTSRRGAAALRESSST